MSRRVVILLIAVALSAGACSAAQPPPRPGQSDGGPVIAAVGDIACSSQPDGRAKRCRYDAVADLVVQGDYDAFLALGDLQYLRGGYDNFNAYYDRYFGPVKDITHPVPGNHETYTHFMNGYFRYFGEPVRTKGDYITNGGFASFDLGSWHLVGLNTQLCRETTWDWRTGGEIRIARNPSFIEGCGPGDSMYEWLKADLEQHPAECTLVYFHHPLIVWNTYSELPYWPGPFYYAMLPLWRLLQQEGVDVTLAGHYHNYQRLAPHDAYGEPDDDGIASYIVGTGGSTHEAFSRRYDPPPTYESGTDASFGILELTLHEGGWESRFVPATGEPAFDDEATGTCR